MFLYAPLSADTFSVHSLLNGTAYVEVRANQCAENAGSFELLTGASQGILRHSRTHFLTVIALKIIIEPPLAGKGPERALQAGLVDAAVTIESAGSEKGPVFARTNLVLALGPGISKRQFTKEDLASYLKDTPCLEVRFTPPICDSVLAGSHHPGRD